MDARDLLKGPGQLTEPEAREVKYPVTHFRGIIPDFDTTEEGREPDTYTMVTIMVTDMEILALREGQEYNFPTYKVGVSYNTDARSKYGALVKSAARAIGVPLTMGFKDMFNAYIRGQVCEMMLVVSQGGRKNLTTGKWETTYEDGSQIPKYTWEFISIGGGSTVAESADEAVARLIGECEDVSQFIAKMIATSVITARGDEFMEAAKVQFQTAKS